MLLPSFSQKASSVEESNGTSSESNDANCTSRLTVVGAGVPGGDAISRPTPTRPRPLIVVATYWPADIRAVRLVALFFDIGFPFERP